MRTFRLFIFFLISIPVAFPLGELPDGSEDNRGSQETLTSFESTSFESDGIVDVTAEEGPTPPSVVTAPLDPLPAMSVPLARPPGFGPPPSFKTKKDSGEPSEQANVGFVVRRGRTKVMGFSRRKID